LSGLDLGEGLGPDEHTLVARCHGSKSRNSLLGADTAPHVCARVEVAGQAFSLCLLVVDLGNLDDFLLDVGEGVEGDVGNLVFDAVLLETEAAASEEDIGVTGGGQVGDTVTDEDDHGDGAVVGFQLCGFLVFVDGKLLVMTELVVMTPLDLPRTTVLRDISLVGDNINVGSCLLSQEMIENTAEDGLQASRDDVEGNLVVQAELVEVLELGVDVQTFLHSLETVGEGNVQRSPHLLGNIAEGTLSGLDLLVEDLALLSTTAEGVEQDVTCVLHEDCAIEV
ncbi:2,3-diketo-5-methylthio-1-phosphopentane phosphatase, partial [Aureobasidium melanogenum]